MRSIIDIFRGLFCQLIWPSVAIRTLPTVMLVLDWSVELEHEDCATVCYAAARSSKLMWFWNTNDSAALKYVLNNQYEEYDSYIKELMRQRQKREEQAAEALPTGDDGRLLAESIASSRPYKRPEEKVRVGDLVVRTSLRTCGNPSHDMREVIAVVCVFSPGLGVREVAVDAFCCPE